MRAWKQIDAAEHAKETGEALGCDCCGDTITGVARVVRAKGVPSGTVVYCPWCWDAKKN
jgi:hypothetical protein